MTKKPRCVAMAGGGTGGHIFPALAVAEELREMGGTRIVWIGSRSRSDRLIVESRGIPYHAIPAGKLRRYFSFRNLLDIFNILGGIASSLRILARTRPHVLFSKGGFVSVPPALAAWILRIPVVSHECDLTPGLATRINAILSRRVHVSFEQTAAALTRVSDRVRVSGNPVRAEINRGEAARGRATLGVAQGVPVLLVVGGSLGAAAINQAVDGCRALLVRRFFVIHQRGASSTGEIGPGYHAAPFFRDEYPDLLAAADLVVCRAGANSLAELSARGKPAVLIPLPLSASRGDQISNAAYRARAGAALVLSQARLTPDTLVRAIEEIMDSPARLAAMSEASRALAQPHAARTIALDIVAVARHPRA